MDIHKMNFKSVNVKYEKIFLEDDSVLVVTKAKKLMEFDENTYTKLIDKEFHNGTIEVQVRSRLLADAPDFARGFIGLAFRIDEKDSAFESFYIRPTNGYSEDLVRRQRAFQYFSYPNYTFDYFREKGITKYEGVAAIDLDEWIDLKAVIQGTQGEFYINDKHVLTVKDLKLGDSKGAVGLFVDIGTQGYFKELKISYLD